MTTIKSTLIVKAISGNAARVQKYRSTHRRIDYVPCPEALAAIEKHLSIKLDNNCLAGVIDRLILAGHESITGNARA